MKRIVSILLTGTVLLTFAGCNASSGSDMKMTETEASEVSEEVTTTTTEATTEETTTEETKPAKLDLSIDEVEDAIFEASGLARGTIAENGSSIGIWYSGDDPNLWDDMSFESIYDVFDSNVIDYRDLYFEESEEVGYHIRIFELDTNTDLFNELEAGDTFTYSSVIVWEEGNEEETSQTITITAINGQYAIELFEIDSLAGKPNYSAPFNNADIQSLYDAFMALE